MKGQIQDEWRQAIVSIDELTLDLERQRVFFFDYDGERARLNDELAEQGAKGTWKKRRKTIREQTKAKDSAYERNTNYDALIAFLMLQIKGKLLRTENDKDQE